LTLVQSERTKRERFDTWFQRASRPILDSPLKADRDSELHREGTSAIRFASPPGSGLLVEPGNATDVPLALRALGGGRRGLSLPLEGPRPHDFYFTFEASRPALDLCREYLQQIRALVEEAAPYT
jgi:hypothetical protein